jgi:hypothetical protein
MPRWRNGRRSGLKRHSIRHQQVLKRRQRAYLLGFSGSAQSTHYPSLPVDTHVSAKAEPRSRRSLGWLIHWICSPLRRAEGAILLVIWVAVARLWLTIGEVHERQRQRIERPPANLVCGFNMAGANGSGYGWRCEALNRSLLERRNTDSMRRARRRFGCALNGCGG